MGIPQMFGSVSPIKLVCFLDFGLMSERHRHHESELGTKEYWDSFYATECANFDDHGDKGETWFGKSWESRIVNWLLNHPRDEIPFNAAIVDIGCGNGSLIAALHSNGFLNLTGLDYSEQAISLAKKAVQIFSSVPGTCEISFETADLLKLENRHCGKYDVVVDKGTFDAVSLMTRGEGTLPPVLYQKNVAKMMKDEKSVLVLVSCNFSKDELIEMFTNSSNFIFVTEIPGAPQISFGGSTGSTVTGVAFQVARAINA